MVHAATISQSQKVMRWRLTLEQIGLDIKHISGEDNAVADAMSRLPTTTEDQRVREREGAMYRCSGSHKRLNVCPR